MIADLLQGETAVVLDHALPLDHVVRRGRAIHVGSAAVLARLIGAEAEEWIVLQTSPPCLLNHKTGLLIEMEERGPERCSRCGVHHA